MRCRMFMGIPGLCPQQRPSILPFGIQNCLQSGPSWEPLLPEIPCARTEACVTSLVFLPTLVTHTVPFQLTGRWGRGLASAGGDGHSPGLG